MPVHTNFKFDPGNRQTMKLPSRPARACDTGATETVDMATLGGDHQMVDVHADVIQAHLANLQLAPPNAPQGPVSDSNEVVPARKYDSQGVDNPDIDEGIYKLATGGPARNDSDDEDMVVMARKDVKRLKFLENFFEEISNFQDASERQLYEVGARLAMVKTEKDEFRFMLRVAMQDLKTNIKRVQELEEQLEALSMRDSSKLSVDQKGDDPNDKVNSKD